MVHQHSSTGLGFFAEHGLPSRIAKPTFEGLRSQHPSAMTLTSRPLFHGHLRGLLRKTYAFQMLTYSDAGAGYSTAIALKFGYYTVA